MAPQGHRPLGGTSRAMLGIHPVEPMTAAGNADILAMVAADGDQSVRKGMARDCSTPSIVNAGPR